MASKYKEAWLQLKQYKKLSITLVNPVVERSLRRNIVRFKDLDTNKNYLERIEVEREYDPKTKKIILHFSLRTVIKLRKKFYGLDDPPEPDPQELDII